MSLRRQTRWTSLLLMALCLPSCGKSRSPGRGQVAGSVRGQVAGVECDRVQTHNAGSILLPSGDPNVTISHRFSFVNSSADQAMNLTVKTKSCGCLTALLAADRVEPGGPGGVTLRISPTAIEQRHTVAAVVTTGLKAPGRLGFRLIADAYPRVRFASLQNLTLTAAPGESATSTVELVAWRRPDEPKMLLSLSGAANWLLTAPIDAGRDEQVGTLVRSSRAFRVSTDDHRLRDGGNQTTELVGRCGDWQVSRPVSLVRQPYVTVTPARLFFRTERADGSASVVLSSKRDFIVRSVEDQAGVLTVTAERLDARTVRLHARLNPNSVSTLPPQTTIVVQVDHPEQPTIVIPTFLFGGLNRTADVAAD